MQVPNDQVRAHGHGEEEEPIWRQQLVDVVHRMQVCVRPYRIPVAPESVVIEAVTTDVSVRQCMADESAYDDRIDNTTLSLYKVQDSQAYASLVVTLHTLANPNRCPAGYNAIFRSYLEIEKTASKPCA